MIEQLRRRAATHTLFAPVDVPSAVAALGFVQIDPIARPAPAQDLILRHRVAGYRAGDLQAAYPSADLEEGTLHVYGVMPRSTWCGLGPLPAQPPLDEVQRAVLAVVRSNGPTQTGALAAALGSARVRNAWGGTSRATTVALETLHWRGLLRVSGRLGGGRVYAAAFPRPERDPVQRLAAVAEVLAGLFAPAQCSALRSMLSRLGRRLCGRRTPAWGPSAIQGLCDHGGYRRCTVDRVDYLVPQTAVAPVPDAVRILAPFDPVVHCRARFEHLFGWRYRFEAYTPVAKRVRGYYAMPMLWRDQVIGWTNATRTGGAWSLAHGFLAGRPRERAFAAALAAEEVALLAAVATPAGALDTGSKTPGDPR